MTAERPFPPVVILAGGRGTRLGAASAGLPKALVPVAGRPFILHQLDLLARNGATDVTVCVGFKGDLVEKEVGPERFGMHIRYSHDGSQALGTLGALKKAARQVDRELLFLYGDTYLRLDYRQVVKAWRSSGLPAVMTVLRNDNRWGRSNAVVQDGLVVRFDKTHLSTEMVWIDYGFGGITGDALDLSKAATGDLADLQGLLAERGLLLAVEATERFYEIGSPDALAETRRYFESHGNGFSPAQTSADPPA